MELAGNFIKFPAKVIPVVAMFILTGERDLYLLRRLDIDKGWKGSVLAKGSLFFRKEGNRFIADSTTIRVLHTGQCKSYLLRQNGFKIVGTVGLVQADWVMGSGGYLKVGDTVTMEGMTYYTVKEECW